MSAVTRRTGLSLVTLAGSPSQVSPSGTSIEAGLPDSVSHPSGMHSRATSVTHGNHRSQAEHYPCPQPHITDHGYSGCALNGTDGTPYFDASRASSIGPLPPPDYLRRQSIRPGNEVEIQPLASLRYRNALRIQ